MRIRPVAACAFILLVGCHHGGKEPPGTMQPPTFIATPSTVVADGKAAVTLTVILSPEEIVAGQAGGQAVTLASTVESDTFASGVTNRHGVYTTTFSSTVAGPRVLTAQVGRARVMRPVTFIPAPAACAGALLLSSFPSMKVGSGSDSLARADFNHDGKLDLVVAEFGFVAVLIGKGDGTFQPRVEYPVDPGPLGPLGFYYPLPKGVATGDFDGDGKIDLVTANRALLAGHGQISVLLGKGDGTFKDAVNGALVSATDSGGFIAIAAGEFNGDRYDDLAVVTDEARSMWAVLINKGDGTFEDPVYTPASAAQALVIADFDGDKYQDVAVINALTPIGNVEVHLGKGNGAFQDAVSYPVGDTPLSLAVGDFNGDGQLDLTTGNSLDSTASVLLGTGNGKFSAQLSLAMPNFLNALPIDLNGDHKDDLVVTTLTHGASSLLSNGNGTFQSALEFNVGYDPETLIDGDFDGDGKLDVATANFESDNMTLLRSRGDGSFVAPATYNTGMNPYGVSTGDLDGDGLLDLVTTNAGSSDVSVLLGKGDGTFQQTASYQVGKAPTGVVIGDFDGDGRPDLASTNGGDSSVSVLIGKGDGRFTASVGYPVGTAPSSLTTGDFNGDGVLDIATADLNSGDGTASVLIGNGDGTFQQSVAYGSGAGSVSICTVDVDGDGKLDLAVANAVDNTVSVLLGHGDGTFSAVNADRSYPVGLEPFWVAAGDLNGDGHPDLVSANFKDDGVSVLLNHGNGTFDSGLNFTAGSGATAVTIVDLDGDSRLDLAVTNSQNPSPHTKVTGWDTVSVLHGNGDGTFRAAVDYPVGLAPAGLASGDFNGDGRIDLVVANNSDNTVSILTSTGCLP